MVTGSNVSIHKTLLDPFRLCLDLNMQPQERDTQSPYYYLAPCKLIDENISYQTLKPSHPNRLKNKNINDCVSYVIKLLHCKANSYIILCK